MVQKCYEGPKLMSSELRFECQQRVFEASGSKLIWFIHSWDLGQHSWSEILIVALPLWANAVPIPMSTKKQHKTNRGKSRRLTENVCHLNDPQAVWHDLNNQQSCFVLHKFLKCCIVIDCATKLKSTQLPWSDICPFWMCSPFVVHCCCHTCQAMLHWSIMIPLHGQSVFVVDQHEPCTSSYQQWSRTGFCVNDCICNVWIQLQKHRGNQHHEHSTEFTTEIRHCFWATKWNDTPDEEAGWLGGPWKVNGLRHVLNHPMTSILSKHNRWFHQWHSMDTRCSYWTS